MIVGPGTGVVRELRADTNTHELTEESNTASVSYPDREDEINENLPSDAVESTTSGEKLSPFLDDLNESCLKVLNSKESIVVKSINESSDLDLTEINETVECSNNEIKFANSDHTCQFQHSAQCLDLTEQPEESIKKYTQPCAKQVTTFSNTDPPTENFTKYKFQSDKQACNQLVTDVRIGKTVEDVECLGHSTSRLPDQEYKVNSTELLAEIEACSKLEEIPVPERKIELSIQVSISSSSTEGYDINRQSATHINRELLHNVTEISSANLNEDYISMMNVDTKS